MISGRTLHGPKRRRPVFQFWGWTMLLVVLLCSAAASGQPRTRLIGSAFDPATTSVALNPKQPRMAAKINKSAGGDLPDKGTVDPQPVIAIVAGPPHTAGRSQADVAEKHTQPAAAIVGRSPTLPLGARAPPVSDEPIRGV